MFEIEQKDKRVGKLLLGYYLDQDYQEIIKFEYRYGPNQEFDILTKIRGQKYTTRYKWFFQAVSELLDQLPSTSAIMLPHRVVKNEGGIITICEFQEWLRPCKISNAGTVVYQLKLIMNEAIIETQMYLDFGSAAEELRRLIADKFRIEICYFCKYLIEYNKDGGTDYRHDQLWCLRDTPKLLVPVRRSYPNLSGLEDLLAEGMEVDALHSCSAFTYEEAPRP